MFTLKHFKYNYKRNENLKKKKEKKNQLYGYKTNATNQQQQISFQLLIHIRNSGML